MISLEDIDNIASEFKICSTLYHVAEHYFLEAPVEQCFTPMLELVIKGWDLYEHDHPYTTIFENGVYANDDSEYLAQGIIYAANNFDVTSILPDIPEKLIPEFRYDLAQVIVWHMRSEKHSYVSYNDSKIDWHNVFVIACVGNLYGKTITL